MKKGQEMSLQN